MSFLARLFCFTHSYVQRDGCVVCRHCGHRVMTK